MQVSASRLDFANGGTALSAVQVFDVWRACPAGNKMAGSLARSLRSGEVPEFAEYNPRLQAKAPVQRPVGGRRSRARRPGLLLRDMAK